MSGLEPARGRESRRLVRPKRQYFDIISTAAIFLLTGSSVATSTVKMLVRSTLLHRDFDFVGRWVCVGLLYCSGHKLLSFLIDALFGWLCLVRVK